MKDSNKCPKCESSELIMVPGKNIPAESGRSIMIGLSTLSSALLIDMCATNADILKSILTEKISIN